MNKEEQKVLVEAWELQGKIIKEIRDLAIMNEALAYGCIRTAETLVDMMFVDKFRKLQEELSQSKGKEVKG